MMNKGIRGLLVLFLMDCILHPYCIFAFDVFLG